MLLNASTLVKGGGIQAAVSYLKSLVEQREIDSLDWYVAASAPVNEQLGKLGVELIDQKDMVFDESPAKHRRSKQQLLDYVNDKGISCVFTFFGPAYVKFPVTHICGVADGWVTHSDLEAYSKIKSSVDKARMFLLCCYKGYWFRKADAWFVEQEAAKRGLARRLFVDSKRVHVVENNCASHYESYSGPPLLKGNKVRILVFASFYPNKNIESVPYVAKALSEFGCDDFEFVLTIDPIEPGLQRVFNTSEELGVADVINNIGAVDLADGPALYKACKLLFMPSVLETFSAVYPEAMAMKLPIVTVDKQFARAICVGAAAYYDSKKPVEAAEHIKRLLDSRDSYAALVDEGSRRLLDFPNTQQKFERLHKVVESYLK